jgi:simple sugar transport system permease protein
VSDARTTAAEASADNAVDEAVRDERISSAARLPRLLQRPELGALVGALALFAFFAAVAPDFVRVEKIATILYASATMGIMVVGVSLLMIGGEFDLSAGVMVTTASLTASLVSYQLTLNVWVGVAVSLAATLALGLLNGVLYVRTGCPASSSRSAPSSCSPAPTSA